MCLHPTGNRWQVPAADDTKRRADGAVNKARPCAQNIRVSREAAANSTPENHRLVARQPSALPPQWQSTETSGDRMLASASQRLLWPHWHLNGTWMPECFYERGPQKWVAHGNPLCCLPFQPFLFLLLEICIFYVLFKGKKSGERWFAWVCLYTCVCACLQSDLTFVGLKKKKEKSICKKEEIYLVKIVFCCTWTCSHTHRKLFCCIIFLCSKLRSWVY